jgi:hypothetical protein
MADPSAPMPTPQPPPPSPFNYILSFLLVGICWGFTTPFIRKAAVNYTPPSHPSITDPNRPWLSRQITKAFFTVLGLLRSPGYAVPLLLNLTGSIWFFLLVGQAGPSAYFFFFFLLFLSSSHQVGGSGTTLAHHPHPHPQNLPLSYFSVSRVPFFGLYQSLYLLNFRTLPHGAHHKFAGVPVHRARRMVC